METKTFQIILYVVFGLFVLVGFASLAGYGALQRNASSANSQAQAPDILIWGTIDSREMRVIVTQLKNPSYDKISYLEKNPETFRDEYLEAISVGAQPDLVLVDHNTIETLQDTLRTIPFSRFPRANYTASFIPAAELFVRRDGYIAIPFLVDTMVLFYNENIRLSSGIRSAPSAWSELASLPYQSVITNLQETGRSLIPLGAYANYRHAQNLFLALVFQVQSTPEGLTEESLADVLRYYASFARQESSVYTWGVSYPDARSLFVANSLFFYPGYISEWRNLRRANAHIPIRVAPLPQIDRDGVPATPATIYGFGLSAFGKYPAPSLAAAFDIIGVLYDENNNLSELFSLLPARSGYSLGDDATLTNQVFANTLFAARSIALSPADRSLVTQVLRDVVIGTTSEKDAAATLLPLFQ